MSKVNLPPLKVPPELLTSPEARRFFSDLAFTVYQLYLRTGGGADIIGGNTVTSVAISFTDSPYTQVNKYERIYVNAVDGAVTVNLLPVNTDIYCDVIKTDASANFVTITAAATINGEVSQDLEYQYESAEIAGNTTEYVVI